MNYFNDNCLEELDDEKITVKIVEQLCDLYFPPKNKNPKEAYFPTVIKELNLLDIQTKSQLNKLFLEYKDKVILDDQIKSNQANSTIYYYHSGLLLAITKQYRQYKSDQQFLDELKAIG